MRSTIVLNKVLFVLLFSLVFLFVGCGYKPTSYYAKKELSGKIFVRLFVDLKDPSNAVLVKDAMNQLITLKLDSKLVHKESLADIIMSVKINSVSMNVIQYDEDGYNQVYKATVNILVSYYKKETKVKKTFTVSGEYNFSIDDDDDSITDTKRYEAIKEASDDALDEVISKIAISSFKK